MVPPADNRFDFVEGIDFVGGQYTDVGRAKLRKRLKSGLKKGLRRVARTAVLPPGLVNVSGQYPGGLHNLSLVEGIDFVGRRLTEVGAGKLRKRIKTGLKKVGKAVGKVTQAVLKVASKVVPPPYNVAFGVASKITDKTASAVQKARAKKAVHGLAALAKRGDKKAAATLKVLKLTSDASKGKAGPALEFVAQAQAKQAIKAAPKPTPRAARPGAPRAPARPAPAQAAAPAGAFQVVSPSGRRFAVHLNGRASVRT